MTEGRRHLLAAIIAAGSVLGAATPALAVAADDYPSRPVKIIVPYAAGGGADTAARAIGQALTEALGQTFIVENRAGAATQTGTAAVARATADGYTLLLGTANLATNAVLYEKLPYDAVRDLAPIGLITKAPVYLLVASNSPITSPADLVARSKAARDGLTFGTAGNGSIPHLAGELFASVTGSKLLHVPYKGSSEAVTGLIGGQVDTAFDNLPPTAAHLKSGRLKALAVATPKRTGLMPDVPTFAELGMPIEASSWWGLLAPAGTPPAIIERLNKEIVAALGRKEMRERLAGLGIEPDSSTPAEFAQWIASETGKWRQVVRQANIKAD